MTITNPLISLGKILRLKIEQLATAKLIGNKPILKLAFLEGDLREIDMHGIY